MKQRLLNINKIVRRRTEETLKEVRNISGSMAELAKEVIKQAKSMTKKLIPENRKDETLNLVC
ncbi:hypothetical protein [Serpentinicella alkaliphila]|nr:hypothetical protein [Serpentinicella alkaliphila]QUH25898.1 hypothetical protein HZR23_09230 [Serpentinicella alkaliphila]